MSDRQRPRRAGRTRHDGDGGRPSSGRSRPRAWSSALAVVSLGAVLGLGLTAGGCGLPVWSGTNGVPFGATRGPGAAHPDRFVTPEQLASAVAGGAVVAEEVSRVAAGRPVVAAVVPHHLVAGSLAAGLFSYLAADPPDTVVIVGPDHYGAGPKCGTSATSWQTAGGVVEADQPLVEALVEAGLATEAGQAQDNEHSVGALMPIVKRYLPQTKVVPITLRADLSQAQAVRLGEFLRDWAARRGVQPASGEGGLRSGDDGAAADTGVGRRVVVVASVDFSHYLPCDVAAARDEETIGALSRGEWGALFGMGPANLDSPGALTVAFSFSGSLESPQFLVAGHTNSAILLGQPDLNETTSHFLLVLPSPTPR